MAEVSVESPSPFHKGEQLAQARLGVRDKVEKMGRRAIRDFMPGQHREFYGQLPFVLLGTVDGGGRPWASIVPGPPGFMTTPDDRNLDIAAVPLFGDPLNETLKPGAEVGVLGMQLETRRRNRLAGKIGAIRSDGFTISVQHTFGNCPQYIQARSVEPSSDLLVPGIEQPPSRSDRIDEPSRGIIERADTLFIATAYLDDEDSSSRGADVSHRGGKPGFVQVEDDRALVFPDFSGNFHFNTIGNILVNPKAGFLFPDFDSGDLVYLTGSAEIVWEGDLVDAFMGAERLIRFRADDVIRVEHSLPLEFTFDEYSPLLEGTGSWRQANRIIAADQAWSRRLAESD